MHRFFVSTLFVLTALLLGTAANAQTGATSKQPSLQLSLQDTQDRLMIEELMSRYEWALDTGDADAYGALFTEDGILTSGGTRETKGRDAITKELRDLSARFRAAEQNAATPPARPRKVIHSYSNVIIELHGNEASAKSNWVEVWNIRDGVPEVGGAGEYHDKLVKVDGRWYFAKREIRSTMAALRAAPATAPRE